MLKIGITGGIGSGKTTVCRIFETLGIPVFYADTVAKEIMTQDPVLISGVKDTFGGESYFADGSLNNKHIAGIVFNDQAALAKLNALVHPAVFRAFDSWLETNASAAPYILKEAALLFESGSYKMCDLSILVSAPLSAKLSRVMQRDGVTEAQVLARMDKQFTDEKKMEMADFYISNDETTSLIVQVLALHEQFLSRI
ncbi:dephospho-CoA kinase [Pedobacter sp. MC2016-14]|uniref:dephospho-CoA kinase n=1 Tax=Pedobacter sp. MC2016-14 TaxID=2897327 RepID=UPI001E586C76|nr:dephospho-CoA kinase [Pedobacter sp. MC2016-14]MCD0489322.1 dephospho-CoA kinase [Pedobacter sp. MC2016-14]